MYYRLIYNYISLVDKTKNIQIYEVNCSFTLKKNVSYSHMIILLPNADVMLSWHLEQ